MHNDAKELVEPIRVVHFIDGIEQTQLKGKGNAIGEFDVFSKVLLVFEAFEMECEHIRKFLYLHPIKDVISMVTNVGKTKADKTYRFSASWSPQQLSQKNLFRWHNISLALNCRKHAVTLEFCSMSIERSRNDSSREDTFCQGNLCQLIHGWCHSPKVTPSTGAGMTRAGALRHEGRKDKDVRRLTVSQVRQRVSEVRVPSKRRWTRVPLCCDDSECMVKVGALLFDIKVATEGDTDGRSKHTARLIEVHHRA